MSVATRYAQALFDLAQVHNKAEQFAADMELVKESLSENVQWKKWLAHPRVSIQQKQAVFTQLFAEKVSEEVLHLLLLLVKNGRAGAIDEVADRFTEMVDAWKNVAHAEVTTAQPLTESEESHLIESLHEVTGKTVVLKKKVDPELIGGVIVRVGDRLYDGSVKGLLERLKRQMVS